METQKFELKDWEMPETGVIVSENEEWFLIQSIPVDFKVDGYKLIAKKHLEDQYASVEEELIDRVLELRNFKPTVPAFFEWGTTAKMLQNIEKQFGLVEFQTQDEEELFYGKKLQFSVKKMNMDMVFTDGTLDTEYDEIVDVEQIRVITFDTDYFNAIALLMVDSNKL